MRARENRQNAEDQRSIVGSIGYIAGNMGYMEGNLSAIDYSYGGAATHYPLWKPHFPRGEAPPPYEEAVAISQAEALSAQCTVSLPASSSQRAVATVSQQQQQAVAQAQAQAQAQQQQQIQAQVQAHQHLQQHTLQLHTQPQQHHQPYTQQLVAHPHPQHSHQLAAAAPVLPQSNQYTQSTTNLINININSGGVTTIATGENHQPPYSLQSEQQQQQLTLEQHHQQQQQHLMQPPVSSGSICLQAMPKPPVSAECSYKNCHLNISASVTTAAASSSSAAYSTGRRTTPRGSQELLHQLPQQQQYLTVADVEINASASAASYHSLPAASGELQATPTHAQVLQHQQQQQHLLAAISSPAIELLQPLEIATISATPASTTADSVTQTTQMPPHGTLKNSQQQQQTQQQQLSKTPSSSRRYHRTIPRYFAVADPLQVKPKTSNSSTSTSEVAGKQANKKPMCQCPIQHVPMSYMGSTANANAFLSGAGKLFATTSSSSSSTPTCSLSPGAATSGGVRHAATLAYGQRAKSSTNLQQHAQDLITAAAGGGTLRRNGCGHEPKIATISKQVGDETHSPHAGSGGGVNVSAIIPPPPLQHPEEVSAPPIVLGRVQKRSSSSSAERGRSTSGGSGSANGGRSASSGGGDSLSSAYLNRKVDAYLSLTQKQQQHFYNQQQQQQQHHHHQDLSNPTLPPKLYKSLTNLKSATVVTTSSSSSSASGSNAVSTIYTLSKPSSSGQRKEQTPTLTLPPASPGAGCGEKLASGKINSSTFYPLANHVTYTLPKNISGKVSLNSTINSVVSKVPSVISIPPDSSSIGQGGAPAKSTTLPKILRVKRETAAGTATSPAIAHCQMPTYPLAPKSNSSGGGNGGSSKRSPNKQLPVCTTSKNCLNPKEHFLPNDTSLDDDYLSECENCKIAQSAKYYLDAEMNGGSSTSSHQETMTLQRKSLEETMEEPHDSYYRNSHTLPSNAKKHGSVSKSNRESWQFSTIPAASSSEEDVNE
ncbi:hypothetical protein KR032_012476 [Drosophila birchii]|nr:hypothetical protein KR032_012476 [Drosophila birchii]